MRLASFQKSLAKASSVVIQKQKSEEWKPWTSQPGPQTEVCESLADEIFVGGPAGIGKTALLLILATRYHRRSIIFRREYPQLKEIIQKSREMLVGSGATYNGTDKIWRNIPGDRTIEFGGLVYEDTKYSFQGREFSLHAYDEVVHFSETQYRYTKAWNRSTLPGERCRVVATGNPPSNEQGRWVIKYWGPWLQLGHPNPAKPGELRWFAAIDGNDVEVESPQPFEHNKEMILPRGRTFITGKLEQNLYLASTGYKGTLQALPEPLRSQLLFGNFNANVADNEWQVLPTDWVRQAMARWSDRGRMRPQTHIGIDVSRGGKDRTILAVRHGLWLAPLQKYPGQSTPDGNFVAQYVRETIEDKEKVVINIDVIGVGSSPFDILRRNRFRINGLNSSERSDATDKSGVLSFANKRAEWWWHLRELLNPHEGDQIQLPDDPELLAELTSPRWERTTRGDIKIESKEEIIKRLGRSCDLADAVIYSYAKVNEDWHWLLNV